MNILFLQGPMGPFFWRLRNELADAGHQVYKINFNAGDHFFYDDTNTFCFQGSIGVWQDYLNSLLGRFQIDMIVAYGDCRIYHRQAKKIARRNGIKIYFFEEGYLRPNYITFEQSGVNANSKLEVNINEIETFEEKESRPVGYDFHYRIWYAFLYYVCAYFGDRRFPHYIHHRSLNPYYELFCWLNTAWIKITRQYIDRLRLFFFIKKVKKNFYFVPLQIKDDAQIKFHSKYSGMADFLEEVVGSFAKSAPVNSFLLIKHHPMDRGHSCYSKQISGLVKRYNLSSRVLYIKHGSNPLILKACRSVITVNSTMGLSSLIHSKPTMVMGRSIYCRSGLCYEGKLKTFWHETDRVPYTEVRKFRLFLEQHTQINASFYRYKFPVLSQKLRFGSEEASSDLEFRLLFEKGA